jgi:hypothetical protein
MNPNYALKVKEDLDKLLDTKFIYPIEFTQWLSLLVIVPKKNGKLRICVDYCKLNVQTKKDPFPLPFLDLVIEHEMYQKRSISFMDAYSHYNQIKMAKEDKDKNDIHFRMGRLCLQCYAFWVV